MGGSAHAHSKAANKSILTQRRPTTLPLRRLTGLVLTMCNDICGEGVRRGRRGSRRGQNIIQKSSLLLFFCLQNPCTWHNDSTLASHTPFWAHQARVGPPRLLSFHQPIQCLGRAIFFCRIQSRVACNSHALYLYLGSVCDNPPTMRACLPPSRCLRKPLV